MRWSGAGESSLLGFLDGELKVVLEVLRGRLWLIFIFYFTRFLLVRDLYFFYSALIYRDGDDTQKFIRFRAFELEVNKI